MAKRALFIVDDRPEAGRGHVVRSGALAADLTARGWLCETYAQLSAHPDICIVDEHKRDTLYAVHASVPFVLISDSPELDPLLVDDDGPKLPALLVNGGAGAYSDMYRDSGARKVLAGPQYALLRQEFSLTQWPLNSNVQWLDVREVNGLDARQLACGMASAKVLITAGGMRAMEAACVGAPMVLFVESEDQRMNAEALQRRMAGVIARDEEHARKLVKELLGDPDWLARMSHAGRSLVDGLGCKRVADAIEEML